MCDVSQERLQLWLDGEVQAPDVAAHVQRCATCSAQVEQWQATGQMLRGMAAELDDVDPLRGLMAIRQRIERRPTWRERLLRLWPTQRWALAGIVAALLVGLATPSLFGWLTVPKDEPEVAVVVESIEVENHARPVVYQPSGGSTTIIWVEPKE